MGQVPKSVLNQWRLEGLMFLLRDMAEDGKYQRMEAVDTRSTFLPVHPFGLPIPATVTHQHGVDMSTRLIRQYVGSMDCTDNVDTFSKFIALRLADVDVQNHPAIFLRVIHGAAFDDSSRRQHLYYEFGVPGYLGITTGMANFGAGQPGKQKLDLLYYFLSSVFRVTIEHVDFPYRKSQLCRQWLFDHLNGKSV